jgi:WD40 repeat protein
MPSEEKERSRGLYWVIGVAVFGPLLYFLSFGPVSVLRVRMQWSPGGGQLASGGQDHIVKVWDLATGRTAYSLEGHTGVVASVAFSPDGTRLASGSWDQMVKVWEAGTGRETLTLTGHTALVYSADGRMLASAGVDGAVRVWDATPLGGPNRF